MTIRNPSQIEALLKLGIIRESRATEWSQVHLVPKPNINDCLLDFLGFNACIRRLDEWSIPSALET